MTLFVNVTDAVSEASNHGITRVERKLAETLAVEDDTEFFVVERGRGWRVDKSAAMQKFGSHQRLSSPTVERFGVDAPPSRPPARVSTTVKHLVRAGRAAMSARPAMTGTALAVEPGDVLVSVGVDWAHDTIAAAEHYVFGADARFIAFCHDLIPLLHPEWLFPADTEGFRRHFDRALRTASKVLTYSDRTRDDFLRSFPNATADDVPKVVLGADSAVAADTEHLDFASQLFGGEPYAIYTATIDRRKNHQLLYRVARQFARRGLTGNLLFVGMIGNGVTDLIDSMRHDPLIRGRVAHLTNCDDQYLAACYQRASFAVYPSLYEGWGLGVTEALANGTRCLVASGSSLGEAGMGVCRELHPLKTAHWVDAMIEYFATPGPAPSVALPTWQTTAEQVRQLATSLQDRR